MASSGSASSPPLAAASSSASIFASSGFPSTTDAIKADTPPTKCAKLDKDTSVRDSLQPPAPANDVRVLFHDNGLSFVHKPGGMQTHPDGKKRARVKSTEPLQCPACGRDFGADEGGAWLALHSHLMDTQDNSHKTWRTEHPEGHLKEYEEAEETLWHVLRKMSTAMLFGPEATSTEGEDSGERVVRFVNRLDRGTSGIVVVAQTLELAAAMQSCWGDVTKTYLVLARGKIESDFVVNRPLTDRSTRLKTPPKKDAITSFTLVKAHFEGNLTLLRAKLVKGGRMHQIRRHLDRSGHQVIGDRQYGKNKINDWLTLDYELPRMVPPRLSLPTI
jgi:23S rRNA-/tRNA-specific pseudouridylate synthase